MTDPKEDIKSYHIRCWIHINQVNLNTIKVLYKNNILQRSFRFTSCFLMTNFIKLYEWDYFVSDNTIVSLVDSFGNKVLTSIF